MNKIIRNDVKNDVPLIVKIFEYLRIFKAKLSTVILLLKQNHIVSTEWFFVTCTFRQWEFSELSLWAIKESLCEALNLVHYFIN